MQARVSQLKQRLEHLFPGKWLTGAERSRNLATGLLEIDRSVTRGISRKRISEWVGAVSSGKTTLLRSAIANWCAAGLNVAYIDAEAKLYAPDWSMMSSDTAKFWIVRPADCSPAAGDAVPLVSKRALLAQEALWSADQFIRCNAFDVVVLDFGSVDPADRRRRGMSYTSVPSRMYARLQRSLDKSKAALIVVRDTATVNGGSNEPHVQSDAGWGATARFNFNWGTTIRCQSGLSGNVMITPVIRCCINKDGISQTVEVSVGSSVENRMFTHPQVPDRRTSKA